MSIMILMLTINMFPTETKSKIIKEISTYKRLEIWDDNKILYRHEGCNCKPDEVYYVNEKEVSFDEFEKLKSESRMKDLEKEEKEKERKRLEELEFRLNSRLNILRKLMHFK